MLIRILIVDDEKLMIETLQMFLEPISSVIDEASDLHSALNMARVGNYNIVILDLRLVNTGKYEALLAIPEFKRNKSAVVVVSGIPETSLKEEVIMAGADAFVPKGSDSFHQALLIAINIATLKLPHDSFRSHDYLDHVKLLDQLAHATPPIP